MDAERIQRQMQEVAVGNYRAFITAADALLAIRQEVSSIDKHLESLVKIILWFPSICQFSSTSEPWPIKVTISHSASNIAKI